MIKYILAPHQSNRNRIMRKQPPEPNTEFSKYLNKKLNERKISLNDLSKITKLSRPRISRWFSGQSVPSVKNIFILAQALWTGPMEMLQELVRQEWE